MSGYYAHPSALVETEDIGDGTRIWAYTHVMPGAMVGKNCNIGDHCFIEGGATVGDNVTIKNGNMIWEGVILGDGVFVGPHIFFTNDRRPRSPRLPAAEYRYKEKSRWLEMTTVEEGATLGAGSVLLPGLVIGRFAMVGAGAVVTKSVPDFALVKGNPAKVVGWVCRCGVPLNFVGERASCSKCISNYSIRGDKIYES